MHELLLYGQVPASRHDQVLKILAGVAAAQPRRILQRCILYKPQREPEEPGLNVRRGGTQNVAVKQTKPASAAAALYYTKLVQKLEEGDFGTEDGLPKADGKVLSADVKDGEGPKWSIRWEDLPDTGDRGVSIRQTSTTDVVSGNPHAQMIATGPSRYAILFLTPHFTILTHTASSQSTTSKATASSSATSSSSCTASSTSPVCATSKQSRRPACRPLRPSSCST